MVDAAVLSGKLSYQSNMQRFWAGFSASATLTDFVDVGADKEVVDTKPRGKPLSIVYLHPADFDLLQHKSSPMSLILAVVQSCRTTNVLL